MSKATHWGRKTAQADVAETASGFWPTNPGGDTDPSVVSVLWRLQFLVDSSLSLRCSLPSDGNLGHNGTVAADYLSSVICHLSSASHEVIRIDIDRNLRLIGQG
ncbi:MAG: hypothetical protein QOH31_906 [Verrucomicrobiota bacterium]|jgi:hypothetical protein